MNQYISQNDHHRKFTEGFGQVIRPFAHLIQSEGSTPLQAVKNLMTTAAGLKVGTAEQKARIVAEIIGNYGVDIGTLDTVLAGGAHKAAGKPAAVDPAIMQALQPVYGFMSEVQQARQARTQRQMEEANEIVERSSTLPYFDDVREDMADLMEVAAKRGIEMTIEQAHEKALALHPEIAKEVARQKATEEARANGGTRLAKARRTASTLTGAPASGDGGKTQPTTRREQLEAAWDDASTH
jgi:hypothetical protein